LNSEFEKSFRRFFPSFTTENIDKFNSEKDSDIKFIVEGKEFYASRTLLETSSIFADTLPTLLNTPHAAAASSSITLPTEHKSQYALPQKLTQKTKSNLINVITVMLSGILFFNNNNNINNNMKKLEIPIMNIDYQTFTQVMQFSYQIDPKIDTLENGFKILMAADFLQLKTLQNYCANVIARFISYDTIEEILEFANRVNCKLLKKHCFAWLLNKDDRQHLNKELPLWQIDGVPDEIFKWMKKLYSRVTTI